MEAIQLVSTTAEKPDAEKLAQAVLERRLAACVQISGPIESRYWWNGRIETATEWTITIKTRRDLYKPLERLLLELHPYDQPEIMATPIEEISAGYLKWLDEQVSQPAKTAKKAKAKTASEAKAGGKTAGGGHEPPEGNRVVVGDRA